MKKEKQNKWLLFGFICIILGTTSFSNHQNWGKTLVLFGAALVSLMIFKKIRVKVKH